MSVDIQKFDVSHVDKFKVQDKQIKGKINLDDKDYIDFLSQFFYALIVNGEVLGFGGLIPNYIDSDIAEASVLLPYKLKNNMIHVHKACLNFIKNSSYRRIYMRCHTKFYESIIWANMLGFKYEGIEREYVKGADFARFSWIRGIDG